MQNSASHSCTQGLLLPLLVWCPTRGIHKEDMLDVKPESPGLTSKIGMIDTNGKVTAALHCGGRAHPAAAIIVAKLKEAIAVLSLLRHHRT